MTHTEQQLKRIQDKLQQLLKRYAAAQKENSLLKEQLAVARAKADEQQKTTEDLKQQVGILKLNTVQMSDADKKEFEKRLSAYIKEIDRCIALLGE